MRNVKLLENQIPHVNRLMQIFTTETTAMDFSSLGLGKTYTSVECAIRLGLTTLFVVCPVSMERKWKDVGTEHGIRNIVVTSFAGLRSISGCQPKHGFLRRISVDSATEKISDGTPKKTEQFEATKKFTDLVEGGGVFMVIDEVHNLKNSSEQYNACKTLTDVVNNSSSSSRCILLSGTPIDKEEQSIKMLRLMGLYPSSATLSLSGVADFIAKISEKDRPAVADVVRRNPAKISTEFVHLCYVLFRDIVKTHWTSMMTSRGESIDCKNGYYKLEERDTKFLEYYITQLHSSSGFTSLTSGSSEGGIVNVDGGKLGAIVKALEGIEQSKIPLFERLVRQTLRDSPTSKVVVGLNFVQRTLFALCERLKDLKPEVITGDTPKNKRDDIVRKFQDASLSSRLIIANIRCLSTGVDLDDKYGGFPRFVFASPNYTIVDLHQFSRRFARVNTVGTPVFRMVYGECSRRERSILNALARKTTIMHDILIEQTNTGIRFPGEYDEETEN